MHQQSVTPYMVRLAWMTTTILALAAAAQAGPITPAVPNAIGITMGASAMSATPASEWTNLRPADGARVIYVAAHGNDRNPGTKSAPVRTLDAGYRKLRSGRPDQLLLRRGDTFELPADAKGDFRDFKKSGESPARRLVIASYGSANLPRPVVLTNGQSFLAPYGGTKHVFVGHLEIVKNLDTTWPESGIHLGSSVDDLVFEGLLVRDFFINVRLEGGRANRVTLRRCTLANANRSRNLASGWPLGLYALHARNLTVEQCIFDHNGYLDEGATASGFAQQIYLYGPQGATIRNNFFVRSGFLGIKVRSDRVSDNARDIKIAGNVFYATLLPIGVGSDNKDGDLDSILYHNVVITGNLAIHCGGTLPGNASEFGNGINISQVENCVVRGNILTQREGDWPRPAISLEYPSRGYSNVDISDNTIHQWPGGEIAAPRNAVGGGNTISQKSGGLTLDGALQAIGFTGSDNRDQWIEALTAQRLGDWRDPLTAPAMIKRFKAGTP